MKKIAILTITNSGMNFGNRLQNFALQEALKRCDAEVKTIRSAKSVKGSIVLSNIRRIIKSIARTSKRRSIYSKFENTYIDYDSKIRYENINESFFADRYDAFVAGSDQVWNPYFHFNSDFEFASFAPKNKRYSYAASIGVSEVDDALKDRFINNLNGMERISVREEDSVQLVEDLTGITPLRHIDPTMLLDPEQYYSLEEKPQYDIPGKYLFMYYLGNVSEEYNSKVREIADKRGLEIIRFTETPGQPYYNIGPQHFVYLLHHADYICTDSFHGAVFSILFKKQFAIFVREDKDVPMNARIETLVDIFGVQNRLLDKMNGNYFDDIDHAYIDEKLALERKRSYEYLNSIISNLG